VVEVQPADGLLHNRIVSRFVSQNGKRDAWQKGSRGRER